jgi:Cyclic nucleotide-binding domain
MGVAHEHFEPGQEIFRQGDLGDRLYIISHGKAEVLREDNGREISLALLGPREYSARWHCSIKRRATLRYVAGVARCFEYS